MFPCLQGTPMAYRYNTPNVDASLRYLLLGSKLRSLIVEDNVQKTSFSICLDPPIPCGLAKS